MVWTPLLVALGGPLLLAAFGSLARWAHRLSREHREMVEATQDYGRRIRRLERRTGTAQFGDAPRRRFLPPDDDADY